MSSITTPPRGRFRRHAVAQAIGDPARRDFLRGGVAAGLALGLPALVAGCSSDGDGDGVPAIPANHEKRTLFFNLSHFDHAGKTHFMVGGKGRYPLVPVAAAPAVLAAARQGNAFLRGVPDSQITHHVEGALLADDSVTICYQGSDIDTAAGTWAMTGVFFNIPSAASAHAYRHARQRTPSGPLPISTKRAMYGLPAAATEADLRDERVLVDTSSYAAAMVGAHPDVMSLEPNSAHAVHSSYVDTDINTMLLAEQLQDPMYGPAKPAATPGAKNRTGWGTLMAIAGDDGRPIKNTLGKSAGRIQYQPALHPDVAYSASGAAAGLVPAVKNDATLGTDVTGRKPPTNPKADADATLAGSMWFRHDGIANVAVTPGAAAAAGGVSMALKNGTPGAWLWPSATASVNGDKSVQVALSWVNWGVRFLGVYVQFLSTKTDPPTVLKLAAIPEYVAGTIVPQHDKGLDGDSDMFLGLLGPAFTVLGIPTAPGFLLPGFRLPASVDQVRVLSGGLAFTGSQTYPDTILAGAIMTGIFNYGMTALMAAIGAGATFSVLVKEVVIPLAQVLAQELILIISSALKPSGGKSLVDLLASASFWEGQGLILAKTLLTKGAGAGVAKLVAWVTADLTEAAAQDAIPVAGWIMLGVSIAVGVANIAETSVELALSPWTFVDDLSFTHDLSLSLLPDPNDDTFPKAADHYSVTALFDDGTPHVQTLAMPATATKTLPAVVFPGVPLGGQVNVSVAFHQAGTATSVDVLLGKGSTGLVPNTAIDTVPPLTIEELKFPINASTVYRHKQKTSIGASGAHVWTAAAAPTDNAGNLNCGGPGTVCAWNAITVRQGTSKPARAGYLGYAWRGQSSDPSIGGACTGGGSGQLDTVANLNTADAGQGYATSACGLDPGVQVAYNLLSHGSANYYLDTTDKNAPTVRQVTLEPAPAFDDPRSGRAWGVFNLLPDALLLHPSGHLISLNSVSHKIETLRLPHAPLTDADARLQLRAQLRAGQGTQPGLLTAPQHAAVAPDGTVVVLEAGNAKTQTPSRLQAFNLSANPVRFFAGQGVPYFLALTATPNDQGWRYLDLAVEFTGFIYVLSYNSNTLVYRLDIYHPTQTTTQPISTTTGINAAKIAIDFWRNVYALNYEVLKRPANGLAEPSVSLWVPSNSCTEVNCNAS